MARQLVIDVLSQEEVEEIFELLDIFRATLEDHRLGTFRIRCDCPIRLHGEVVGRPTIVELSDHPNFEECAEGNALITIFKSHDGTEFDVCFYEGLFYETGTHRALRAVLAEWCTISGLPLKSYAFGGQGD